MTKRRENQLRKLYAAHTVEELLMSLAVARRVTNAKISMEHAAVISALLEQHYN